METAAIRVIPYNKKTIVSTVIFSLSLLLLLFFLAVSFIAPFSDALLFTIAGVFISMPIFFKGIKAFFHILEKKPMLELTPENYTDNLNNLSIPRQEISYASLHNNTLLVIYLVENSSFYQGLNPLQKLLFTEENEDGICIFCNIKFAQGKPKDILELINTFKINSSEII